MMDVLPLADLERAGLALAMETYGPRRKKEAAQALGISLKTLYEKLAKFGLADQYVRKTSRRPKLTTTNHAGG